MRILIINTDYPAFLKQLYDNNARLNTSSYSEQLSVRNKSYFGVFDAYSKAFQADGHEAFEIHANNGFMQRQWMLQQGKRPPKKSRLSSWAEAILRSVENKPRHSLCRAGKALRSPFDIVPWQISDILVAQAEFYRPDVILNQSVSEVDSDLLDRMRCNTKLIVGQIASPMPEDEDYHAYDMMISSLPNFVAHYEALGIPARLNRLAFDARALKVVGNMPRDVDVSFVGSISHAHRTRLDLLEYLCNKINIDIWGSGVESLCSSSPVLRRYHGEAWGLSMFRVLGRSRITINSHIGIAEGYANNMRLFEATGMGSLLITDRKSNITEIFEPDKEVVCYDTPEECLELINYYRKNESARASIATAGQRRTLFEHTYSARTAELIDIFKMKYS